MRLTEDPPEVATLLLDFMSVGAAADTVSAIIAAGMVPAALEMMDQRALPKPRQPTWDALVKMTSGLL